jgi:hypothetical protein
MSIRHLSRTLVIVCALIAANLPIGPMAAAPQALSVWVESISNKVQPTTALGSSSSINLEGAQRSVEAAQIIVRANGSALTGVSLTASDLSDGHGHTLTRSNITFFREYFINFTGVVEGEPGNKPVPANSPTSDPNIADPLIPFTDPYTTTVRSVGAPFNVAANRNQPVWIDFNIPEATTGGIYTGVITVSATGEANIVVPVTLTVWNFVLPDMRSVTTHFRLNLNTLIWYHRNTYACRSSDDCWLDNTPYARTLVKRYEELAHDHRIDTAQSFIPDFGNDCNPPNNWNAYDAALQPYMTGSYWNDGVPSSRIETPFTPGADWGIQATCTPTQYTALAQAWASHLKSKGWFTSTIVYALDEPDDAYLPDIAQDSQYMQAGDADWKARIMDTTDPTPADVGTLNPALGIYCVALKRYDHWNYDSGTPANEIPYGRSNWPTLFAQNIQLWFYESNAQSAPYPTFATNTLWGGEPRLMLWGSWYEKATGFLYWDTTSWHESNPWGPNVDFNKSGDGVLIYPGHHDGTDAAQGYGSPANITLDGPVPSYRLKVIRAGLQDWALFKLAEQRGFGAYARDQVARAYGQLGRCEWSGCPPIVNGQFLWKNDSALLDNVRHNIAMKILGLNNVAPNTPSNPNPIDHAVNVFTIQPLAWLGGDPDGQPVTYTVAFGINNPPSNIATVTQALYAPGMITNTLYYWRITATDGISQTIGPLWQFTTIANEQRVYLPVILR